MNRRLKNWVTIAKSVKNGRKGLLTYLRYLTNNQHQNHLKEGHVIRNFQKVDKVFLNMCVPIEKAHNKQLLKGTGGRAPSKGGHSFTVNFPFHYKSAKEEKGAIQTIIYRFFARVAASQNLKIERDYIVKHIQENNFYNVHRQKTGSKTQFNFVLTEYLQNSKLDLSKKKYLLLLKNIGIEVAREKGYEINDYFIKSDKPISKIKVPANKYKLTKQKEALESYKEEIDSILDDLAQNVEKRLLIYLKRMESAIEEADIKKFEKNKLLVEKNLYSVVKETKQKNSFKIGI